MRETLRRWIVAPSVTPHSQRVDESEERGCVRRKRAMDGIGIFSFWDIADLREETVSSLFTRSEMRRPSSISMFTSPQKWRRTKRERDGEEVDEGEEEGEEVDGDGEGDGEGRDNSMRRSSSSRCLP